MVRSMTGFGRGKVCENGLEVTVELKSVNHRFFEFSSRLPRGCNYLEEPLKELCRGKISRGKLEVSVTVDEIGADSTLIEINEPFADAYISALGVLSERYGLENDIKLSAVAAVPDVFNVKKQQIPEETVTETVLRAAAEALDSFIAMRKTEGEKLENDLRTRAELILGKVSFVEKRSPETVKAYREKLEQRIRELLSDASVDEQRLLTETAIFADKTAVDEETVRLRSHISQLCALLDGNEPVGRRLDFIVQEMNREANTIGSKAQDIEIAHTVVDIKAEIEKIREQIQNIE